MGWYVMRCRPPSPSFNPTSVPSGARWSPPSLSSTAGRSPPGIGPRPRGGPVSTRARRRLFSPLHSWDSFLMRAGLSRRQLGWRGDLCAGVPAASDAGVSPLSFRRAAPRGVPARLSGAVRQSARSAATGGGAGTARVHACGLVEHGCARLWCGTCRTSVLCPFSCRGRNFCPSCEKKKQLLWAEWLQKEVLEPVPHRHVVLTMPRLLRGIFRKRRELLLDLSQCAADALAEYIEYMRRYLGADTRPGIGGSWPGGIRASAFAGRV